jgi:lysophospholipase L1-like esterase
MKFALRVSLVIGAAAKFAVLSAAADTFFFRDGDRVVFLGDSITEQRLYTTYIEGYALTRYPERKFTFRNVGWGGDTAWLRQRAHPDENKLFAASGDGLDSMVQDAVARGLERDVLPLKPTVVTIKFGMNDHSYQPFREDIFRAYVRSEAELVKVLEGKGARVALLTPQPIEEKRADPDKDPRNESLRKFSDGLKDVASRNGALYVDQFDPFMRMLLKARANNPPVFIGGGDAVHPGPIGHTVMAWAVLKGLGASAPVSAAEIDAGSARVVSSSSCEVRDLKAVEGTLKFDRLDRALPMPIDPRATQSLNLVPVLEDLDQYILKVTGLTEGEYELSIDGEAVGKVGAAQLAKGWNLAENAGPIGKQVQQVLTLIFEKNDLYFARWRQVQLYQAPAWLSGAQVERSRTTELQRLDDLIADAETRIDAARKPKLRHFELKRLGA